MRFADVALLAAVVVGSSCGAQPAKPAPAAARAKLTAKDIYQQSAGAIVKIEAALPHSGRVGTGFVVDQTGLVATNLHVVVGSDKIRIKLGDGNEYEVYEVVGYDKSRDLALLRIHPPGALPTIRLGDSDQLIPGDQVVAIGNPLGVFDNTVSAGLISSVRVFCTPEQAAAARCPDTNNIDLKFLQITAPISQGSSGGPLFNQYGEVVGITSGIIDGGQAINIAVPGNYLKALIARPRQIAVAQFATDTRTLEDVANDDEEPPSQPIVRVDPGLTEAVFDGCADRDVVQVASDIEQAIEAGAPLYNTRTKRGYEACFRIYEGTALHWKTGASCKGVGAAFAAGLERATTLATFNEKAWAIRDTFDGLVHAAQLWAMKHRVPTAATPSSPPPSP